MQITLSFSDPAWHEISEIFLRSRVEVSDKLVETQIREWLKKALLSHIYAQLRIEALDDLGVQLAKTLERLNEE